MYHKIVVECIVIGLTYLSLLVERYNPEGEAVKGGSIVHSRGGEGKGAGGVRHL